MSLQFIFALIILKTLWGASIIRWVGDRLTELVSNAEAGSVFMFGEKWVDHPFVFGVSITFKYTSLPVYNQHFSPFPTLFFPILSFFSETIIISVYSCQLLFLEGAGFRRLRRKENAFPFMAAFKDGGLVVSGFKLRQTPLSLSLSFSVSCSLSLSVCLSVSLCLSQSVCLSLCASLCLSLSLCLALALALSLCLTLLLPSCYFHLFFKNIIRRAMTK